MKTNKMIVSAVAAVVVTGAWATDWYVDAVNGNDQWDGSTATVPSQEVIDAGETIAGPRRTLHAMMSDDKVVAGHTVWAAEGDYNEGGTVYGTYKTVNRVQVKAGVTLRASGSRDNTFITGSGGSYSDDSSQNAYSNGAVRCVYFIDPPTGADYGGGIVKGFTLREGRTGSTGEHGGASTGAGLLVECDLVNNGCGHASRGGTMNKGTALRCKFTSSNRGYLGFTSTRIIDSLVVSVQPFYQSCSAYNSTFSGNSYFRQDGKSYNCLYIGAGAKDSNQNANGGTSHHYSTFSFYKFYDGCTLVDDNCRVVNDKTAPYDPATFRPLVSSQTIDGGTLENYALATNGWKQAWLDECGKDYYGGERVVNGKIDVGCGEFQGMDRPYKLAISDDDNALVIDGAEIGEKQIDEDFNKELTFLRKLTSEKLLAGIEINGEFYSFGGTTNDYPVTASLKWKFGTDYVIKAVYEENQKDWYVSPTGDDANPGYHIQCPRKTLDKAMELAKENAGHIVHAAAGIYDKFSEGYTARSRVTVKEGVGLVADEWPLKWPLKETIIVGASDTSAEADGKGNGPGAVRCVHVKSGGYVRGFKLVGGRTVKGDDTSARGGGAYLAGGAVIDCEITDTGCAHRGRAVYASDTASVILRCHIHDTVCGSYDIYNGKLVDSYAVGNDTSNYYTFYGSGRILNSCVLGGHARSSSENFTVINSYLKLVSEAGSSKIYCTNCVFTSSRDGAVTTESKDSCFLDEATCRFSAPIADNMDENFRPKTNVSPLVDAGSRELYDKYFPSEWAQFKDMDVAGGQRIYNAQIDVGCGEYDWRGDFALMLGTKAVVSEMGPNVTTDSMSNIVIPEGDSIALSMPPRSEGRTTKYELTYTPEGGERTVVTEVSSDAFSYTLAGPCTVQSLTRSGSFANTIR